MVSRRDFLIGTAVGLGFGGLASYALLRRRAALPSLRAEGYGELLADPAGILDLPKGFSYQVIGRMGEPMADGLITPGRPDTMACFPAGRNQVLLVCNHELASWHGPFGPFGENDELFSKVPAEKIYDPGREGARATGGTTTLLYDLAEKRMVRRFLSLAGTVVNCSGGPTPRRSWLTCEENFDGPNDDLQKRHGYVFEVPASETPGLADPVPLTAMGRFIHEAAATDPATGIVYLTEDQEDGLFYRFLPNDRDNLRAGGTLQALALRDWPAAVTANRRTAKMHLAQGQRFPAEWVPLKDVDPEENILKARGFEEGAAQFARGEGIVFGERELYFTATSGGPDRKGQIWRYLPAAAPAGGGEIELFIEPDEASVMENPDNLAIAPTGDVIFCEDGPTPDLLRGITPEGKIYDIARNDYAASEFAGACFSPDGLTLFVNLQDRHETFAITGPWGTRKI